jgi:outer membrane lipoprotein-sorting protein
MMTGMRFGFRAAVVASLMAGVAAGTVQAQPAGELLSRLDQFARTFTGAKANVEMTVHNIGVDVDDRDSGVILIKRSAPGKMQLLLSITGTNAKQLALHDETAEIYYPQMNRIDQYDLRAYGDTAQKLFALGFGMPGRELSAGYGIKDLGSETVQAQQARGLELIPNSADVLKKLKKVELWISGKSLCPVRQKFYFPDGGFRIVDYSDLQINPKLPPSALELPKGAKRVRQN